MSKLTIRYEGPTQKERISGVARRTATHWHVIHHVATRVTTARAWARIHAVLIDARFDARAIRIHRTLRPTVRVRVPEVIRKTGADAFVAIRVRSTG